jgi:hypothetical protein
MHSGALVAAALFVLAAPAQQGPPSLSPVPPPRETFISAAEVVLDNAAAVDLKADNDHFNGAMQQLRESNDNLNSMAADEGEKNIAATMKDIIFQISSCHIQAIDGTPMDKCEAQINSAERQAMAALKRHKEGSSWAQGPPA